MYKALMENNFFLSSVHFYAINVIMNTAALFVFVAAVVVVVIFMLQKPQLQECPSAHSFQTNGLTTTLQSFLR
jgi:hypothetical protein